MALIGNGKIKMVEMDVEEKLMKCRIGRQPVLVRRLTSFGIMVQKICIGSDLKEWLVFINYIMIMNSNFYAIMNLFILSSYLFIMILFLLFRPI